MKKPLTMSAEEEREWREKYVNDFSPNWPGPKIAHELEATRTVVEIERTAHAATEAVARELAEALTDAYRHPGFINCGYNQKEKAEAALARYNAHKDGVLANDPEVRR